MNTSHRWAGLISETNDHLMENRIKIDGEKITIRCFARVHTGAIDLTSNNPRGGGFGFALPNLAFEVAFRLIGDRRNFNRYGSLGRSVNDLIAKVYGEKYAVSFTIQGSFLRHKGFGSGTQIRIAALQAVSILLGKELLLPGDVARLGIGNTSSVGIRTFYDPRPFVDLGSSHQQIVANCRIPYEQVLRMTFPTGWHSLALWPNDLTGLSSRAEEEFWRDNIPASIESRNKASSAILLGILRGIFYDDISSFQWGISLLNESSTKSAEWSSQHADVLRVREILQQSGLNPLLSSMGPGMIAVSDDPESLVFGRQEVERVMSKWSFHTEPLNP